MFKKFGLAQTVFAALALTAVVGVEPAKAAGPELKLNYNFGVTTDYIFRGFSQSARNPAVQGGIDATYGIFYLGVWASSIKFKGGVDPNPPFDAFNAWTELDVYGGAKPVLKTSMGDFTFDFGFITYNYPGAFTPGSGLNYVELKAGVSKELWKDSTLSTTLFYSPEYTLKTGSVWTSETTLSQNLPAWGKMVPSVSGTLGYQWGDTAAYAIGIGNGDKSYAYWNVGGTLTFDEKVAFDVRYWDTSVSDANKFCSGTVFQCDSRFVASMKVTF